MASTQTEPPPPLPSGKKRVRSGVFIAVFVALQFLVPLSYLLRDDASDERFTWRSLTAPESSECEARATVARRDGEREQLALETVLHEDWVDYVRLGRRAVVDAFLEQRCAEDGVASIELVTRCSDERSDLVFRRECNAGASTPRTAAR